MRYLIYTLLCVCLSCYKQDSIGIFEDENDENPTGKLKDLIKDFEFYVIYYQPNDLRMEYKIFGMKKENNIDSWYKIDFIDAELTKVDGESLFIDYHIRKSIPKKDADDFKQKLINFGLFRLIRGKVLTEDCAKDLMENRGYPETMDRPSTILYVYSDSLILNRNYYDPVGKYEKCPSKKVWKDILSIDSLFQYDWIKLPLGIRQSKN